MPPRLKGRARGPFPKNSGAGFSPRSGEQRESGRSRSRRLENGFKVRGELSALEVNEGAKRVSATS